MGEPARKLYDVSQYRWQPGKSGNPAGRAAYPKAIRDLLILKREKWTTELLEELHGIVLSGKRDSDRVKAAELLLSYLIGKPREMPDLDGPEAKDLPLEVKLAAVKARAAELEAELKGKNGHGG